MMMHKEQERRSDKISLSLSLTLFRWSVSHVSSTIVFESISGEERQGKERGKRKKYRVLEINERRQRTETQCKTMRFSVRMERSWVSSLSFSLLASESDAQMKKLFTDLLFFFCLLPKSFIQLYEPLIAPRALSWNEVEYCAIKIILFISLILLFFGIYILTNASEHFLHPFHF